MSNNYRIRVIITLLLSLLTIISCIKHDKPSENVIKIGVILPLTGTNSKVSKEIKQGIDLAVDIINHNYDIPMLLAQGFGLPAKNGMRIKVLYKGFGNDRHEIIQDVDDLVQKEKVHVIIGCYASTATLIASERADLYGVPFINFDSTSPNLTERGLNSFFRTTADDEKFSSNFFVFLKEMARDHDFPKRIVLIYENSIWGTNVAQAEIIQAEKNNYKIVKEISYDYMNFNPDLYIEEIQEAMPAIIMQASYDYDAVEWIRQYEAHDINPIAILAMDSGFTSSYFLKELGSKANNIISRECWAQDYIEKNTLANTINKIYLSRYSGNLNGNSARAFTGMMTLGDILNRAKSLEYPDIILSARHTHITKEQLIVPWEGVQFDNTGQNQLSDGIIVQLQDQKYNTVWPRTLSSHKTVWPKPKWKNK